MNNKKKKKYLLSVGLIIPACIVLAGCTILSNKSSKNSDSTSQSGGHQVSFHQNSKEGLQTGASDNGADILKQGAAAAVQAACNAISNEDETSDKVQDQDKDETSDEVQEQDKDEVSDKVQDQNKKETSDEVQDQDKDETSDEVQYQNNKETSDEVQDQNEEAASDENDQETKSDTEYIEPGWIYYVSSAKCGMSSEQKEYFDNLVNKWTSGQITDDDMSNEFLHTLSEKWGYETTTAGVMSESRCLFKSIADVPDYGKMIAESKGFYNFIGLYTEGDHDDNGNIICYYWEAGTM